MELINRGENDGWARLDVTLSPEETSEILPMIYMDMAVDNNLRPQVGETARQLCEEKLGKQAVQSYVEDSLMIRYAPRAFGQAQVNISGQPQFYAKGAFVEGQPFEYRLSGVVKLNMELSSYEPVVLDGELGEVADDEIDFQINMMLDSVPDCVVDTKRTEIMANTLAKLSLVTTFGGEPFPALTFQGKNYEMGKGHMPQQFDQGIKGMKVGETRTVSFVVAGQSANTPYECTVTLEAIMKTQRAELTDEWVAEHFSTIQSVKELRMVIKSEIAQKKYEQMTDLVISKLAERLVGDIPDDVFDAQLDATVSSYYQAILQQGVTQEQYLEASGMNEQQLHQEFILRTREQLRQEYALDAVARHNNMTVTEGDMQLYYHQMAPGEEQQYIKDLESTGGMYRAREEALRLKAARFETERAIK